MDVTTWISGLEDYFLAILYEEKLTCLARTRSIGNFVEDGRKLERKIVKILFIVLEKRDKSDLVFLKKSN